MLLIDAPFGLHFQVLKLSPSDLKHPYFLSVVLSLLKSNLRTWEHHLDRLIHLEDQSHQRSHRPIAMRTQFSLFSVSA